MLTGFVSLMFAIFTVVAAGKVVRALVNRTSLSRSEIFFMLGGFAVVTVFVLNTFVFPRFRLPHSRLILAAISLLSLILFAIYVRLDRKG